MKGRTHNRGYKFLLWRFVLIFAVLPFAANAQSLILKAPKAAYSVGDSFQVSLSIDTKGQVINTLSGTIKIPTSYLQIIDIRYGNSIVSLWVERPAINAAAGTITFTGGVPGGFSGSAGPILSFGVRAKKAGAAAISFGDIKVLLNDGLGTELKNISLSALNLTIKEAPLPSPKPKPGAPTPPPPPPKAEYIPPPDTVPPEDFIPVVSRHPTVADNKYFVSFFAVDKDSGVSRYEIIESPFILSWLTKQFDASPAVADTPYILQGQYWAYNVLVRACDQAENCKEAYAGKPFHPYLINVFVLILLAVVALTMRHIYKPRKLKKRVV